MPRPSETVVNPASRRDHDSVQSAVIAPATRLPPPLTDTGVLSGGYYATGTITFDPGLTARAGGLHRTRSRQRQRHLFDRPGATRRFTAARGDGRRHLPLGRQLQRRRNNDAAARTVLRPGGPTSSTRPAPRSPRPRASASATLGSPADSDRHGDAVERLTRGRHDHLHPLRRGGDAGRHRDRAGHRQRHVHLARRFTLPTTGRSPAPTSGTPPTAATPTTTPPPRAMPRPNEPAVGAGQPARSITTSAPRRLTPGHARPRPLNDTGALSGGYYESGHDHLHAVYRGSTLVDTESVPVTGNGTYSTPTGYTLPDTGHRHGHLPVGRHLQRRRQQQHGRREQRRRAERDGRQLRQPRDHDDVQRRRT